MGGHHREKGGGTIRQKAGSPVCLPNWAGRLHVKLLSQQDFFKVVFIQRGQKPFVLDADFRGGFVFQET